jgi:P-type Cu+ transporter
MSEPCYHCGEDCGNQPVLHDEKAFCCQGCKMVFEILSERDVCRYYDLEQNPGTRLKEVSRDNKYNFLDSHEAAERILDFSEGGIAKVKFFIPVIHCSSCIWLLENLYKLHDGIVHSTVNFVRKEAYITYKQDIISLRRLAELLHSIGYPPQISLDDRQKQEDDKKHRRVLNYRIGVAGFAFGNIMLMALPDYLAGGEGLESSFRTFFSWANFVLATPVFFYSGAEYFISAWKGLRSRIINIDIPIVLGMMALYGRSIFELLSGIGTGYFDSLAGFVFFLLIGKWYQGKSYQALSFERDYKSYFPVAVTRFKDGGEEIVLLENIKAGDRLLIRNQELIPADALLVKGEGHIDYSFVSGESTPVEKRYGDSLYAGGRQLGSAVEIIVEKEVEQSYLTQLWNQENLKHDKRSQLQSHIDKVSKNFTIYVLLIAFGTLAFWLWKDSYMALNAFTAVLIVACPCALALTIPFAMGNSMRIFGRNGFYVRSTAVVEAMAAADEMVFDKTGTITAGGEHEIEFQGKELSEEERHLLRSSIRHSTHPLSQALLAHLEAGRIYEVGSFSETAGQGISTTVAGQAIQVGSAALCQAPDSPDVPLASNVHIAIGGKYRGFFSIRNRYRPGLEELLTRLDTHFNLHLISGDNDHEFERLQPLFSKADNLHFRQSPMQKLDYIRRLKQSGGRICMVGDGLNDAGALSESHVGISVADDVFHFSPACDGILESGRFADLDRYFRLSRRALRIVKASFLISISYNVIGLSFAVQSKLTPLIASILMPASSVMVVAFVSLATLIAARQIGLKS